MFRSLESLQIHRVLFLAIATTRAFVISDHFSYIHLDYTDAEDAICYVLSPRDIFQHWMHKLIERLSGVKVVADDFVVVGEGNHR